jgi:carboxyl-terminal processing protease
MTKIRANKCATFLVIVGLLFTCVTWSSYGRATDSSGPTKQWFLSGNAKDYELKASGSPLDAAGAIVSLSSSNASPREFGGSLMTLDASQYRGRSLMLSGVLSTQSAENGAAIWLRADGPHGVVAFINSQQTPVLGSSTSIHREVHLDIPESAVRILFGVLLKGSGKVEANEVRLNLAENEKSDVAPNALFDVAARIVSDNALYAGRIDWKLLRAKESTTLSQAKIAQDAYPAIREMLKELGDNHSFLMQPWEASVMRGSGSPATSPDVSLLAPGVGYASVPAYFGTSRDLGKVFASDMVHRISSFADQSKCGWIVDLRKDKGGNMWPMIAGLRPLLGRPPWGGFVDARGQASRWRPGTEMDITVPAGPNLDATPVAVLIGRDTASSGEAVAVAFKGRPKTRFFGVPTYGLSTGNGTFDLPDGSRIMLTTVVDVDRAGNTYGKQIQPDQWISDDKPDETVKAASDWLKSTCDVSAVTIKAVDSTK